MANILYPTAGYTLATKISCIPPEDINFSNADAITWYFGDGEVRTLTYLEGLSTTHIYKFPGVYGVSAVAYTDTVNDITPLTYVATASCSIINYIENALYYTVIPPPTVPGFFSDYPYKIIFTTTSPDIPIIDLYAEFSRSYAPQEPQNKWSFVRPEWKFLDIDGNVINKLIPTSVDVIKIDSNGERSISGTPVGLSGCAEFYFIDDIYSVDFFIRDAPTPILWASFNTSAINTSTDSDIKSGNIYSYSTTELRAYAPHASYWKMPDYLKITENGISNFNDFKWVNAPVPFFVSAQFYPETVQNKRLFNPDTNFVKFIPYAVSARNAEYVECAEDIPLHVTVTNSASCTFTLPDTTTVDKIGTYTLNQTDEYGYTAAGFARGVVEVHNTGSFQISAAADVYFDKLHLPVELLVYSPYVWIPNPAANALSMVYYTGVLNQQFAESLHNQLITNQITNINTPTVTEITTTSPGMHGFNGIYAVAASPGSTPDYTYYAWVADADLDKLYKYDTLGKQVCSVDLKQLLNIDKVSPAYISLDREKNMWITCYDTLSVLKLDINGNLLFGVDPTVHVPLIDPNIPGMFDIDPTGSIFHDVNLIEPTCIDTDLENNVWVSYSNPVSSYLIKYSSNGTFIKSVALDTNSTPQDVLIDVDNAFWVAESHEVYGAVGSLKKYNSNGVVIAEFNNIKNIGYLTCDTEGNPWFTYEYNKIGKIKNNTFTHVDTITSAFTFGVTGNPNIGDLNVPPIVGPDGYLQYTALEGISGSHKNLIFVVHSIENNVYVYNARNDKLIDTVSIVPKPLIGAYNDANSYKRFSQEWNKSIQVIGDWTGIRWSRKYTDFDTSVKRLRGTSKVLNFNKFSPQEIRKHNQDFNMASHLQDFALSPALHENDFLFNKYFAAVYGTAVNAEDAGTVFYEKTANFLANHNDIDTCEIDQLYSLAAMLDYSIDDYRLAFPAQLKQIMNLMSITHSKLWGIRCRCNSNFRNQENCTLTDICKICGKCKINNRGEKINTAVELIKEGEPIVIYEKAVDTYFLHYPATVNMSTSYPSSQLTAAGLMSPVESNYEFYRYIPTTNNVFTGGVIDWDSTYTTLSPSNSTYNDWIKENGIIDSILNFYLYKGLNLIQ